MVTVGNTQGTANKGRSYGSDYGTKDSDYLFSLEWCGHYGINSNVYSVG